MAAFQTAPTSQPQDHAPFGRNYEGISLFGYAFVSNEGTGYLLRIASCFHNVHTMGGNAKRPLIAAIPSPIANGSPFTAVGALRFVPHLRRFTLPRIVCKPFGKLWAG
jgi:hypothetical protein